MESCRVVNRIKEECNVYFETCVKEEPEFYDSYFSFNSDKSVEFLHKNDPIRTFKRDEAELILEKDFESELCSTGSDSFSNVKKYESDDVQNEVECKYYNIVVDEEYSESKIVIPNGETKPKGSLQCHHCAFTTNFRGNLVRHIKFKHTNKTLLECPKCSFKCRFRCELKRHSFKHVEMKLRRYKYSCFLCVYNADKKFHISRHIFHKHAFDLPDGCFESITKCPLCSYETDIKSDLLNHFIDRHMLYFIERNDEKSTLYPCGLCSRVFTSKSSLISHIDGYHKKIRLHSCHLCDFSATFPAKLRIHITAKHDKITPFKCDQCKYATAYRKHLKRHVYTQHVNKKIRKNARKESNEITSQNKVPLIKNQV